MLEKIDLSKKLEKKEFKEIMDAEASVWVSCSGNARN